MTKRRAVADSSFLVALLDTKDSLHARSVPLQAALTASQVEMVLLDVLVGESVSVLARRCAERREMSLALSLDRLEAHFPADKITWVGQEVRRLYLGVLEDVRATGGRRNFNDALVALLAQELEAPAIVSFDADFDDVPGLNRLSTPERVAALWPTPS